MRDGWLETVTDKKKWVKFISKLTNTIKESHENTQKHSEIHKDKHKCRLRHKHTIS